MSSGRRRSFRLWLMVCTFGPVVADAAFAADDSDQAGQSASPSVYLDLRTTYATAPGGAVGIGFGNTSLFSVLGGIALATGHAPLTAPTGRQLPAVHAVTVDIPLTVDLNDRVSVYGGVSANASTMPLGGWTNLDIGSWNVGFQAELFQQNGGALPTITVQSTITRSLPSGPLATTSFNNVIEFNYALDADETKGLFFGFQDTRVIEFNYALDADETKGLFFGFQDTRVTVDSVAAEVRPGMIGYAGGYYQWPSNWKASARVGMQSFGGVDVLNRTLIPSFTQPVLRFDLDQIDDNDNRVFGLMLQIQWIPQPSYQLTFRTPLYLTQN